MILPLKTFSGKPRGNTSFRNKIGFAKHVAFSNFGKLSSPYKATFMLTYRCNLKCRICRIWEHQAVREMDLLEIEKTFRHFKNLGWIDLSGGEITLREDVVEVIRTIIRVSKKLCIFHASTNGQRPECAEQIARELGQHRLLSVMNVSVDGPEELHDRLRGVPGAFARSIETFSRLKKAGSKHCFLSCTLSSFNIDHIESLLRELKKSVPDFNPSDIHFNLFHQSAHYYKNQRVQGAGIMDASLVRRYLALSRKGHFLKGFLENRYLKGAERFLSGDRFPVRCQALNATCFIDPSGTVYPCGSYDAPVGSLARHDHDIRKLWTQPLTVGIRREIQQRRCPGCWSPCEAYPAILGNLTGLF